MRMGMAWNDESEREGRNVWLATSMQGSKNIGCALGGMFD